MLSDGSFCGVEHPILCFSCELRQAVIVLLGSLEASQHARPASQLSFQFVSFPRSSFAQDISSPQSFDALDVSLQDSAATCPEIALKISGTLLNMSAGTISPSLFPYVSAHFMFLGPPDSARFALSF